MILWSPSPNVNPVTINDLLLLKASNKATALILLLFLLFCTSYAEPSHGNPADQVPSPYTRGSNAPPSRRAGERSIKCPTAIVILHPERLLHLEGCLQVNEVCFARYEETTFSIYRKHSTSVSCLCIIKHARANIPDMKVKVVILSRDSKCLQLLLQFLLAIANLTFGDGSSD